MADNTSRIPGWIVAWFSVTAAVCAWDATFIMLRPYSLPGGKYSHFWYLYKYYVTVDKRYGDISDSFVFSVSLLNYVEIILNVTAIFLHYSKSRHTIPLAFTVSVMTFWKTVLYFLMFYELGGGGDTYRKGNTVMQEFFLVIIPNIIWIILPLATMVYLWNHLIPSTKQSTSHGASKKKQK